MTRRSAARPTIAVAGVYVSNEQSPVYGMVLNVRTSVDPLTLQTPITAAIRSVNKDQAISDIRSARSDQGIRHGWPADSVRAARDRSATVALILAGIGIYGVIS